MEIGEQVWFAENLRLETKDSYFPNFNKGKQSSANGNYYAMVELDQLCPTGWRVAGEKDWDVYFQSMMKVRDMEEQAVKQDTITPPNVFIFVEDRSSKIQLYNMPNPLNLSASGWVQGNKLKNLKSGTMTMWVRDEISGDKKLHVHIGANGYVKHSHDHHIVDEARKNRKFVVRCVQDKNSSINN